MSHLQGIHVLHYVEFDPLMQVSDIRSNVVAGVTDLKTLHSPENSIQPDYYTNQLSDLLVGSKLQTPTHQ